ncbi:MAG TPA: SHOCT domain-containing protein [Actinomycetes bacterium]|nr:SHOCT domain-containing protein [Actinomycetes bacterium]
MSGNHDTTEGSTMTLDTIQTIQTAVIAHDLWNGPGAWWPIIPLLWLLFFATVVTLFVTRGRRRAQLCGPRAGERALAERYAAGEIDDAEYARRLGVLRSTDGR